MIGDEIVGKVTASAADRGRRLVLTAATDQDQDTTPLNDRFARYNMHKNDGIICQYIMQKIEK
jgi:hypothetical protein